ncbi:MAG: hypothetical protein ACHQ03_09070 [Candidatus Bathyarchaeia archaeon]
MTTKGFHTRTLGVVILVILLQVAASVYPTQATTSSIVIYGHGFAKAVKWIQNGNLAIINGTSSFTQDDNSVYSWLQAAFYNANFTWKWYDPTGILYSNSTEQLQCVATPCYATSKLYINWNPIQTRFGRWRLDLLNGNAKLYSDYFYMNPVLTQINNWNFELESSAASIVHSELTVTIHPNNGTWSYYQIYMPYAINLTAFEVHSNTSLMVTKDGTNRVVVNLGGPRSAGYEFVIEFAMKYGLSPLNGWDGGAFGFTWLDAPWYRFNDPHPIYETFNVTLPQGADLVDVIGINTLALKYDVAAGSRQSLIFDTTVIRQLFGWTIIYHDFSYRNAHPGQNGPQSPGGFNLASGPLIPYLPLTLSGLNVWSAIVSVFLLTASELASPIYGRTGSTVFVDRKRLRIAALILVLFFIASTGYQFVLQYQAVAR